MGPLVRRCALLALVALAGCGGSGDHVAVPPSTVDATVETVPFAAPVCGSGFREIAIDHTVELRQAETAFDANGAGVAIGDLDSDGRLDIVLGNLDGPIRVLWNDGGLQFSPQVLVSGRARAVQLVDVDGDDDLDIVLAPGFGAPLILDNGGAAEPRTFRVVSLPGVVAPAYSMLWLDPDTDGDLDAVVAAYDMEFGRVVGGEYVSDGDNGVHYLEQLEPDEWSVTQLADLAHALAVTVLDVDADGDLDLVVGNDFGVPDGVWLWEEAWVDAGELFPTTAANTMSFDVGDVDLDGDEDLYATDMAPPGGTNVEFWEAMVALEHDPPGPQLVENVLVDAGDDFTNRAPEAGIEATGWSWSGRLLDLDQDRDLDVIVANGMLMSPLFPEMAGDELVEPNLAYRNDGNGSFTLADDWGLASTASTRGIAAGDLDGDGDPDLVASTVGSPARILVNELCEGGAIVVEPRRSEGNTRALGARVTVATGSGRQSRTIRSGIGYLSADPPAAHVGLGDETVDWVEVRWTDGETTVVEAPALDTRLVVTRD